MCLVKFGSWQSTAAAIPSCISGLSATSIVIAMRPISVPWHIEITSFTVETSPFHQQRWPVHLRVTDNP